MCVLLSYHRNDSVLERVHLFKSVICLAAGTVRPAVTEN